MKKGRLSKEEIAFLEQNASQMSVADLAKEMDRDPDSIGDFVKRKLKVGISSEDRAAYELEARPYWVEIQQQFTDSELDLFKYHWSRIISQFKDDVIPTEELQVIDLIKLEILMNRCLKQSKGSIEQIGVYESLIADERARDIDQQDRDAIFNLDRQIATLRASQETMNRDYRELQMKKGGMLKDMKATREQRVKRLEDSKQSFIMWIAQLMGDPERTRGYGLEMEKRRLAMDKEKQRLSAYHKYEDGAIDQPFLNSETVID